jgi:acetyl-CoA synthetase
MAALEQQLEQESFAPAEGLREQAVVQDSAIDDEAESDPEGIGPSRRGRLTGTRCSTGLTRRSRSGSSSASSTSPTTASTATSRPATAIASPTTGAVRRARSSTSPTPTCTATSGLKGLGVRKGDVVAIYLPMIPEVTVAMLACARIGAIHNVVFGGFSAESVRERIEFSEAKVLITVVGARRKGKTAAIKATVDEVIGDLVETIVVVQRVENDAPMKDGRDHFYHELLEAAGDECPPEPMGSEDPLHILYTSGSTAKPKGIVHTTGGYLTGVAYTHQAVFDLKPSEDVYWCAIDVGWIASTARGCPGSGGASRNQPVKRGACGGAPCSRSCTVRRPACSPPPRSCSPRPPRCSACAWVVRRLLAARRHGRQARPAGAAARLPAGHDRPARHRHRRLAD